MNDFVRGTSRRIGAVEVFIVERRREKIPQSFELGRAILQSSQYVAQVFVGNFIPSY